MTRLSTLAAAAVACLALTSCASSEDTAPSAGDDGQGGYPRTIQHAMGETTIESKPRTVAALDSSYVDAALALETQVVAYTKYPTTEGFPSYLGDDPRFAKGAQEIGLLASPDVERLYDIQPDLIVSAKVRHEELYSEFSNVAPTVFSETTGGTWKQNIRLLAKALGKEQLAERKIGAYEQRAQRIGDAIVDKLGKAPTYSLVRFVEGEPTVRLYSSKSFPGIVLSDVGLKRPASQPDTQDKIAIDLSQERISDLDADRIYVSNYADETQQAQDPKAEFRSNPLWGKLQGKISEVNDDTWYVSVSLQGAHTMLDDLARQFGVNPMR